MWYLSNSQDVVSNSHVCSGAYCGFQHSPSVTEILLHFPVSLSAVVSLIQTTVAAPLALAVTEWENIRHVIGKNCSLCHQSICHSCQCSFGYQTLHFSAGCMDVPFLQWNTSEKASKFCRDPITLNKEKELIYVDALHGDHCSGKQKAMSMRWFTVR